MRVMYSVLSLIDLDRSFDFPPRAPLMRLRTEPNNSARSHQASWLWIPRSGAGLRVLVHLRPLYHQPCSVYCLYTLDTRGRIAIEKRPFSSSHRHTRRMPRSSRWDILEHETARVARRGAQVRGVQEGDP